jgi:ferrous iron transport protein A
VISERKDGRLSGMRPGSRGRVVAMSPDCALCLRLVDHGLTPGCEFLVTKVAPMGGPVEIETRGVRVCVRSCEADLVCIEPIEPCEE